MRPIRNIPSFDMLENRETPAVQAFFAGGILSVFGDASANTINVAASSTGQLQVTSNGSAVRILAFGTPTLAGTFAVAVFAGGGADRVTIDASLRAVSASLYGGAGNDTLTANHRGNTVLFGDQGDDTLTGGAGMDALFGGAGDDALNGRGNRDSLNGGSGKDSLDGGSDSVTDLLIGGFGADTFIRHPGQKNDLNFDFWAAQGDVVKNAP
jgi:Ca2+-binding RTX toxin-like protein